MKKKQLCEMINSLRELLGKMKRREVAEREKARELAGVRPGDNALAIAAKCVEESEVVLNGRLRSALIQCIAEHVHPLLTKDKDPEIVALTAQNTAMHSEKIALQERLTAAHAEIDRLEDGPGNATKALEIAAQCWCDKECSSITMDTVLAEALAKRI